jgi:large subunit ribosomal protein L15
MRLHDLKPSPGSRRERKRLGRGNASGQGTTAGKGTKGEKARSGGVKAGFRGMSSRNQRLAKRRGFTNIFKTTYEVVNVGDLNHFTSGVTINPAALKEAGLISKGGAHVKLLGDGDLADEQLFTIVGMKVSKSARAKIEAAGGSVEVEPDSVGVKRRVAEESTARTEREASSDSSGI